MRIVGAKPAVENGNASDIGPKQLATGIRGLYRWLLGYALSYKKQLLLFTLLAVAEVIMGLALPWPMKLLVDNVLGAQPLPDWLGPLAAAFSTGNRVAMLIAVCGASLLIGIASELISLALTQLKVGLGQKMVLDLRSDLFSHLQKLSLHYHQNAGTGDAIYRLDNDAYCIESIIMSNLFPLANAFLMLTLMLIILLHLDWSLALLSLAVIPFLFATIHYYSGRLVDRSEKVKEMEAGIFNLIHEVFSSIRLVKAFSREHYEKRRFVKHGLATLQARMRLTLQESLFSVIVTVITYAGTAMMLAVGGWHVLRGELSIGQLLVVIAYLGAVYGPLSSISHTIGNLQESTASARRVYETLKLEPEIKDLPGAIIVPRLRGHIRFECVSFAYRDSNPVLKNISFEIKPGQMAAIVGLTGAGKTTLVSLIPRFYDPTGGRITIDGIDIKQMQLKSLRNSISIVLQEPILFSSSIEENISYGRPNASQAQIIEAAKAAQAHDFIIRMPDRYRTLVGDGGGRLSGGERQRIAIARAILKDAPILILDEPTSSLDSRAEGRVFQALRTMAAGRTMIVIAHRLSTVRGADKIIVLDGGEVIGEGPHEELLLKVDLYRELCARLSMGSIPVLTEEDVMVAD